MARVDPARAEGAGDAFGEGTTVEPVADEYGRQVIVIAPGMTLTVVPPEEQQTAGVPPANFTAQAVRIVPTGDRAAAECVAVVLASDRVVSVREYAQSVTPVDGVVTLTTASTVYRLSATPTNWRRGVTIIAPATAGGGNSAAVYIGNPATIAVGRGYQLNPGYSTGDAFRDFADGNQIGLVSSQAGQKVFFVAVPS